MSLETFIESKIFQLSVDEVTWSFNYSSAEKTFSASATFQDGLSLSDLVEELAGVFKDNEKPAIPDFLDGFKIIELKAVSDRDTYASSVSFECTGKFDFKTASDLDITLFIKRKKGAFTIRAQTKIAGHVFKLSFDRNTSVGTTANSTASSTMLGSYQNKAGKSLNLRDLAKDLLSPEIVNFVPNLNISIDHIYFAWLKEPTSGKKAAFSGILMSVQLSGGSAGFSDLPVIGGSIPADFEFGINVQAIIASKAFSQNQVNLLNQSLQANDISPLPVKETQGVVRTKGKRASGDAAIAKGFNFGTNLKLGSFDTTLLLSAAQSKDGSGSTSTSPRKFEEGDKAPAKAVSDDTVPGVTWIQIQRNIGPVRMNKVGARYKSGELEFLLDGSVSMGGMTISLTGLGLSSPIDEFKPSVNLYGFGLGYEKGAVSIAGGLLKDIEYPTKNKAVDYCYNGALVIKTSKINLGAIASYAQMKNGDVSLFIYAMLNQPLGGPSFFFVTGLALGFGLNRKLIMPPIEEVSQFPLITPIMEPADDPKNRKNAATTGDTMGTLMKALDDLNDHIPPSPSDLFFAIGLKFTTFKLLESFALLVVSIQSNNLRVDVLGMSKLSTPSNLPAGKDPIAYIELSFLASFVPSEGSLLVQAQLTDASYVLSKDCKLQGGFAFASWFSGPNAGDFVFTVGGYHPAFKPEKHYPVVPRVGFHWVISPELNARGGMYYALTGSAIMAGCSLEANFDKGPAKISLKMSADFLICWKPFRYDIRAFLGLHAEIDLGLFSFSINLSAELHIWGPEFAGIARIDLDVASFQVKFGKQDNPEPEALKWDEFRKSFLPKTADEYCVITLSDGLLSTYKDSQEADVHVVNPKSFSITTDSVFPIRDDKGPAIAVGTMKITKGVDSAHTIKITKIVGVEDSHSVAGDAEDSNEKDKFTFTPVRKKMPRALWGPDFEAKSKDSPMIENFLAGYEIVPKPYAKAIPTEEVSLSEFAYDVSNWSTNRTDRSSAFAWNSTSNASVKEIANEASRVSEIAQAMKSDTTLSRRNEILKGMGLRENEIDLGDLSDHLETEFLVVPEVVEN